MIRITTDTTKISSTTDKASFTIDKISFTIDKAGFTTAKIIFTTDKIGFTIDEIRLITPAAIIIILVLEERKTCHCNKSERILLCGRIIAKTIGVPVERGGEGRQWKETRPLLCP